MRRWACREYLDGWDPLELPPDRIPTLRELNARITPRTGWRTIPASVRYTDAVPVVPFTIENVIPHEKSVWSHNDVIFVIESVDQLAQELERYLKKIRRGRITVPKRP